MLGLRAKHPEALTADFRKQYNLSIWEVGKTYTYKEASYLIDVLMKKMGTHLSAEIAGWDYPMSSEDAVLRDIFDLLVKANSDPKKPAPKPYRRPFAVETGETTIVGTPISWEASQSTYQFSSSKTEEEIMEANKQYIEANGSLTNALKKG